MKYCEVYSFCRFYNGIFHQKIEVFSKTNIMIFLAFFRTDEFNKNMTCFQNRKNIPVFVISPTDIKSQNSRSRHFFQISIGILPS